MKPIDFLIAVLSFCVGAIIGVFSERNQPKPQPKPSKHFEFKQKYKKRLEQFHTGELNFKQYKDSVYVDIESFMIRNINF